MVYQCANNADDSILHWIPASRITEFQGTFVLYLTTISPLTSQLMLMVQVLQTDLVDTIWAMKYFGNSILFWVHLSSVFNAVNWQFGWLMESDVRSIISLRWLLPGVWLLRYRGTGSRWWNWINCGCPSVWSSAGCWHFLHQSMKVECGNDST